MSFTFSADSTATAASEIITNTSARGMQIVCYIESVEDDPTVTLGIASVAHDDDDLTEGYMRIEGIPVEGQFVVTLYPGVTPVTEGSEQHSRILSAVIPGKFQMSASNTLGRAMTASFHVTLLP